MHNYKNNVLTIPLNDKEVLNPNIKSNLKEKDIQKNTSQAYSDS